MVELVASDGARFSVDDEVIKLSALLSNMIEDLGECSEAIPLPNVKSDVLAKVVEFCEFHKGDVPDAEGSVVGQEDSRKRTTKIDEWDAEFFEVKQDMLFDIILAANYLDIKSLLDVGCRVVANMLRGKTTEQIRKLFNIVNDFTPEEEAALRKENEWSYER